MIKTKTFILKSNSRNHFSTIQPSDFLRLRRQINTSILDKHIKFKFNKRRNNLSFKQINFELLTVFYSVVIFGSIKLAAEHLSLSQPAISLSLQKIEKETGCILFRRSKSTKSLVLNSYGLIVFNYVERLFQIIEECLEFSNPFISDITLTKLNKIYNYKFLNRQSIFNLNKTNHFYFQKNLSLAKIFLSQSIKSLLPFDISKDVYLQNHSKFIFFKKLYTPLKTLSLSANKSSKFKTFEIEKSQSLKNLNNQIFCSLTNDNLLEIQTISALTTSFDMKISELICWGSEI